MKRTRVLIVEDSPVVRELLAHVISQDPRLEVAAAVPSAEEALRVLDRVNPDVISMDLGLPGMDGLEATRRIMSERPTPIVVVSGSVRSEDLQSGMDALKAGALSVVEKPVGLTHADYGAVASRLCTQLAIMSEVRLVRQRAPRPGAVRAGKAVRGSVPAPAPPQGGYGMLGVVASTGGPNALAQLLTALGPGFPLPVLLVQHITPSFSRGFADWLDGVCPLAVRLAEDGEAPLPGRVHVAPADHHLRLQGGRLRLAHGPAVSGQRPSGTVLFESLARELGPRVLAVLLTGMGDDGAAGLRAVRDAGGYTLAEDATTAVVYGMPAAAVALGAVCESLPLPVLGPRVAALAAQEAGR